MFQLLESGFNQLLKNLGVGDVELELVDGTVFLHHSTQFLGVVAVLTAHISNLAVELAGGNSDVLSLGDFTQNQIAAKLFLGGFGGFLFVGVEFSFELLAILFGLDQLSGDLLELFLDLVLKQSGREGELGNGLVKMNEGIARLQGALDNYDTMDILARMAELRKIADSLETVVSNDKWPLPKYREMLFLY